MYARWSEDILVELSRTLTRRFGKTPANGRYREAAMRGFFPNALVHGYGPLISQLTNHPKVRHVLPAALTCRADHLATFNLRDFPSEAGERITVVGQPAFLKTLLKLERSTTNKRINEQAAAIGFSAEMSLDRLAQSVPAFVEFVRDCALPGIEELANIAGHRSVSDPLSIRGRAHSLASRTPIRKIQRRPAISI